MEKRSLTGYVYKNWADEVVYWSHPNRMIRDPIISIPLIYQNKGDRNFLVKITIEVIHEVETQT